MLGLDRALGYILRNDLLEYEEVTIRIFGIGVVYSDIHDGVPHIRVFR